MSKSKCKHGAKVIGDIENHIDDRLTILGDTDILEYVSGGA